MRPVYSLIFAVLLSGPTLQAQTTNMPQIHILDSGKSTNLRGLSSINGIEIWVSGSNGWIAQSTDGGKSWNWQQPGSYHNRDFRDIAALSSGSAAAIAIDTPALILKTNNFGKNWKQVYYNNTPGMFLDAMDFTGSQKGIVVGDPIDGQIFLARTTDGAESWQPFSADFKDSVVKGEAFFAASGSNIHLQSNGHFILASGGAMSRLWKSSKNQSPKLLPFQQGIASAGPNGMDIKGKTIAIVGGDYTKPNQGDSCFAISFDGGETWAPQHHLPGYGSAVSIIGSHTLVACGLTGVWLSKDAGKTWITLDNTPFNTLLYIAAQNRLLLAGPAGKIGVMAGF